jgi:hypothetical protein
MVESEESEETESERCGGRPGANEDAVAGACAGVGCCTEVEPGLAGGRRTRGPEGLSEGLCHFLVAPPS